MTVIGVVADVHHASLDTPPTPTIYVPHRQDPWPSMTFAIRTAGDPAGVAAAVREAVWRVDKDQPFRAIRTMDEQLAGSVSGRRFSVALISGFGVLAIVLAGVGLYGVLALVVNERRREIGVRMALGATRGHVTGDVIWHGLRVACAGVVVGLAVALVSARLIQATLYGIAPSDAVTFVSVSVLMVLVAVVASAAPAWKASRVDPLEALREG